MKIVVSLHCVADELADHPLLANRPKCLLAVSGVPILEHILGQMKALLTAGTELILVGEKHVATTAAWVRGKFPQLTVQAVNASAAVYPLIACRPLLTEPTLLVMSDSFVVAEFEALTALEADAAVLVSDRHAPGRFGGVAADGEGVVQRPSMAGLASVGAMWLREPEVSLAAVAQADNTNDFIAQLLQQKKTILAGTVTHWIDINSISDVKQANRRLLGTGYGTDEALERSYIEEFAVIPPVFLHHDAIVEASVIGPYASIGAGAVVRSSVVQNCVIEENAQVANCILEDSFIGRDSQISGPITHDQLTYAEQ
ncbi:MAG: NDP-sugar synthase [Anaerolineales bacterium]|nr:NDP-sugar synthase [Anaerolineales bacterium]